MFTWIRYHLYELNIFVVGWCSATVLSCLLTESYALAALNAVLVYANIKMAQSNK